jgi:TolA-binding protein
MSNRVEELESTVAELRAAVDGLTEELVETRERLRQLEADREAEPTRTGDSVHAERMDAGSTEAEAEPETETETETDEDNTDTDAAEAEEDEDAAGDDEIIVA